MRRSLRLLVNNNSDEEAFLLRTVTSPHPPARVDMLRSIELFKSSPTQYRSVTWYLPFRVLLNGRWTEPRVVMGRDSPVFETEPQDNDGICGLDMIAAYERRQ